MDDDLNLAQKTFGQILKESTKYREVPRIKLATLDKRYLLKGCLKLSADIRFPSAVKISMKCLKCSSLINNCFCEARTELFTSCYAKIIASNQGVPFYIFVKDLKVLTKIFDFSQQQKTKLNQFLNEYGFLDFYSKKGFVPKSVKSLDKRRMIAMFTRIPGIKTIYGHFSPGVSFLLILEISKRRG